MDIIRISKTINELGYRVTHTFGRGLWNSTYSDYGDYGRVPYSYIPTNTGKKFFVGSLSHLPEGSSYTSYQDFPKVSKQLLKELFASIGVEYVPEITLYQLDTKTPFESFEKFCKTFSQSPTKIDASEINDVVLKLKEMDALRGTYALNSKPIYSQLSLLNFDKANEKIELMSKVVEELELTTDDKSQELDEAKETLIQKWDSPVVLEEFRRR